MAGGSKDRSSRAGRKSRRAGKHQSEPSVAPSLPSPQPDVSGDASDPPSSFPSHPSADQDPTFANPSPNPSDESGWGYCTEEQLEELLLKNLDFVYKEALGRLVSLGYDEEVALRAILCSGHCYGSMDVLSNILHNALAHLNAPSPALGAGRDPSAQVASDAVAGNGFTDLRHLQEYSLAGMVCLLQQVRPNLSRGDAMWCLLMSDLHVGRASAIEIPALPPPAAAAAAAGYSVGGAASVAAPVPVPVTAPQVAAAGGGGAADCSAPVSLCKFHSAAAAAAAAGNIDPADPLFSNLSPSMKSALRRSAFMMPSSTGFRPFVKPSAVTTNVVSSLEQQHPKQENVASDNDKENTGSPNNDIVESVLKALEKMNIADERVEDPKKEMIVDVIRQIRELEVQVKERKEWAQQKALQAARKLSNDMTELRMLRMEREENQRLKKGKQALEDTTMKRLSEMENALKKASGQVDRANAAVRRLELENAEIRAEMEASKLSASESAKTCAEVTRREKKSLKKLAAWEKQKEKMQDEIAEEKKKIVEMQQRLEQVRNATKENESKCRQEMLVKEQAIAMLEEERRAKEAAKVNANRIIEAQRQKIELDVQRHKDDIKRLEEELARLKASAAARRTKTLPVNNALTSEEDITRTLQDVTGTAHNGLNKPQEVPQKLNYHRKCIICKKDYVSIVFLPCAHQVVCTNCNEDHDKKGKTSCPCCNVKIEERIRVFGAASS